MTLRTLTVSIRSGVAASMLLGATLHAQQPAPAPASEDTEPRIIGVTGATSLGISGFVDRFYSSERRLPTNYTAHVDVGRFITPRIMVRGGMAGSGSIGGADADDLPSGSGAAALHAFGGATYYLTPLSMASIYAGAGYWAQLTRWSGRDAGMLVGTFGVQGAISSRAGVFIEGGYGVGIRPDEDGVRPSRLLGQLGVRLTF
jgi:hypothetical protein